MKFLKRTTTLFTLATLLLVSVAGTAPSASAQATPPLDDGPHVPRCVDDVCFYQLDTNGACTGGTPLVLTLICAYENDYGNDEAGCGNGGHWSGYDQVYVDALHSALGNYKVVVSAWQSCDEEGKSGWIEGHGVSVLVKYGYTCPTPVVQATGQHCVTSNTQEIAWETDSENGCRVDTYEYHQLWAPGPASGAMSPAWPTVNDAVLSVLSEHYDYVFGHPGRPFFVFLDSEEHECPAGQAPPNPGWGTFLPIVP